MTARCASRGDCFADPHAIWALGLKRARQQIWCNRVGVTAIGGANASATRSCLQLGVTHQARHTLARCANTLRLQLGVNAWAAIGSATVGKDGLDLACQLLVALFTCAQ